MCRQWFEELEHLGDDGLVTVLRAASPIHTRYLQNQCAEAFSEAFQNITGELRSVRFIGPDDTVPGLRKPNQTNTTHAEQKPPRRRRNNQTAHTNKPAQHNQHHDRHDHRADQQTGHTTNGHAAHTATADTAADNGAAHSQREHAHQTHENNPPATPNTQQRQRPFVPSYRAPVTTRDGIIINPDCTFENFVVGPENRMPHAASKAVADNPGRAYNPLFIHGGVGLGKSHLLQAICHTILAAKPDTWIHYVSCEAFSSEFFDAVKAGDMSEFRHRYRDVDVLVVDDIHFLAERDRSQEEFFHTFNILYQSGKQIVLSSDAAPHQIPDLEQRLVSRFSSGLVTEILKPGYETRIQIAKSKAKLRGIDLNDDVACYIAAKISSNIREIEGAITKIHMRAITDDVPISEPVARLALGSERDTPRPEIRVSHIIDIVTDHYGVKMTDILSRRKPKSIALPRQVCMYLAREHTRNSLQEIGAQFGGRDHTTVIHAHRVVAKKRADNPDFDQLLTSLEERL
jgi:chromosomal replication initiator protein